VEGIDAYSASEIAHFTSPEAKLPGIEDALERDVRGRTSLPPIIGNKGSSAPSAFATVERIIREA
jgi:hypothetical protein